MKIQSLISALFLAAVLVFGGCGDGANAPSGNPSETTKTVAGKRKILYWRAPMNPNEIYDKPGKSQMGMDLVPVYADDKTSEGIVAIDPVMMQNIGVRTARVEIAPLNRMVRTSGRFEMDEQGARTVTLKISGWVEKLYADFEGAMVREGEPLLELYSPALVTTQEEYLLAVRHARTMAASTLPEAHADAERLLAAARRRLAYWDLTDEQIRALEATGVPQRTVTFYAPATGEVMAKDVTEGDHVEAGKPLMQIFDLRTIWLIADVYEKDFPWIKVGTPARVELPYAPGLTYAGKVDYIYHMMAEETRTVRARIALPGGHHTPLKPGMYATIFLQGIPTPPGPVVPEEAVLMTGEHALVILALGDGRFRPVEVRTGVQSGGMIQILDGLRGGETVVISAQFLIDSEARLKSAVGAMLGGPAETSNTDTPPNLLR